MIGRRPRLGLSVVVIELLLGVALGPQGLAIVSATTGALPAFATLGLAFLFFTKRNDGHRYATCCISTLTCARRGSERGHRPARRRQP